MTQNVPRGTMTIGNALRCLRVAAPSIHIVPWAALASCWPLPQQLLPVFPLLPPAVTSSPGAGEVFAHWRRSSLLHSGHIQRKIYFNFVVQESLRTFLNHIFTRRVVKENYICNKAFGLVNPCYQYFRFYNSSVLYYNEVIAFIPLIYRRNLPCW